MNKKLNHLISSQIKIIGRDSLLLFLIVYPLILAVIGRLIIPIIGESLANININIKEHYPALMVFFVVMNPVIYGAIMGLMLLDERENNTVLAVRVLPIKFSSYILSKCLFFTVLSVISGMIVTVGINLYPVPLFASFLINLVSALGVIFGMLLINIFSKNKVEGFATLKMSGFFLVIPVASFYIPAPFNFITGLAPAFWPSYAIAHFSEYSSMSINPYFFLLIGLIYIITLCVFMYKILMKRLFLR